MIMMSIHNTPLSIAIGSGSRRDYKRDNSITDGLGDIRFSSQDKNLTIQLSIIDDDRFEGTESFIIQISSPNSNSIDDIAIETSTHSTTMVFIVDDESK